MFPTLRVALAAACTASALLAIRAHYAGPGGRRQVYVFKPLTTALILVLALVAPSADPRYQVAIAVGLALSLVGDVFLMLPTDRFLTGLVSFLLAHIAYLVAFTSGPRYAAALTPFLVYGVVGAVMFAVLLPGLRPRLRVPVAVYVVIITLMAAVALARWLQFGGGHALAAAGGAGLFVVSDALLALDRFRWSFRSARAAVLGTYWGAQCLIALSVGT